MMMDKMKGSNLPTDKWEKDISQINVGGSKYCNEPSGAPEELKNSANKLASYIKSNKFNNS